MRYRVISTEQLFKAVIFMGPIMVCSRNFAQFALKLNKLFLSIAMKTRTYLPGLVVLL